MSFADTVHISGVFFCVSQNLRKGKMCNLFICVSHFLRFEKFLVETLPDIISAYVRFCVVKVIAIKANIRSPDIRYIRIRSYQIPITAISFANNDCRF